MKVPFKIVSAVAESPKEPKEEAKGSWSRGVWAAS